MLCGHTRLSWAVSRCETFEPSALWRTVGFCLRLICSRGWKRFNGGRPLHRVGPWSFSKELFFLSRAEGTTIEGSEREKECNIQEIFYWKLGLACLTLEERGRSAPLLLSGNLGINQGLFLLARHHFKILPQSWKSLWGFSFVVWVLLEGLSLQTGYLVSSWVTNRYFCYRQLTEMTSFSSTVAASYFTGVASGDLKQWCKRISIRVFRQLIIFCL